MAKYKKSASKLAGRITSWDALRDTVDTKNKKHPVSGFYMRKPGSQSK